MELDEEQLAVELPIDDLLAIDEALGKLEATDQQVAQLLKLRYFAGMSVEQAAELLGIPARTAYRHWAYGRAWIFRCICASDTPPTD